jgi:hypothetical protein
MSYKDSQTMTLVPKLGAHPCRKSLLEVVNKEICCVACFLQVVPLVLDLAERAGDRMAQHASFDVTGAAKRITSDVMGHLLYGEDLRGVHWE